VAAKTKKHQEQQSESSWQRFCHRFMFAEVDIASLAFFRIVFGLLMLWEVWTYLNHDFVNRLWVKPLILFPWIGFDWIQPWSGAGMNMHFTLLGLVAVGFALGLFYRLMAVLWCVGFVYVFMLDQTAYQNHFYLISLMSVFFVFMPLNRAWSLDAKIRPSIRSNTIPAWCLWTVRVQLGIVYFYGGIAKINGDWFAGEPLRAWLRYDPELPAIWQWLSQYEAVVYFMSYSGLLLDLFIFPLLVYRRTRIFAAVIVTSFHLMNMTIFNIGIFPWMMLFTTTLFFEPDWPRRLWAWIQRRRKKEEPTKSPSRETTPSDAPLRPLNARQQLGAALLVTYFVIQMLLPLRHHLYPGNAMWTTEGGYFAWHMRLFQKEGYALFKVRDPATGREWTVSPMAHMSPKRASLMTMYPDMILQYAYFLARDAGRNGIQDPEVRADIMLSMHGRPLERLVNPDVDLTKEQRGLHHKTWLMRRTEPLPDDPVPLRIQIERGEVNLEGIASVTPDGTTPGGYP
jgi:hypothetical protein